MVASGCLLPGLRVPDGVSQLATAMVFLHAVWYGGVAAFHAPASHSYVVEGDIKIGAIFSMHKANIRKMECDSRLRESGVVQYVEALNYVIDRINSDPEVLPNVSLGFVAIDDCATPEIALAGSLAFLPLGCQHTCRSSGVVRPVGAHDVVAVIGADSSPSSAMIANVLGLFAVPQISPSATSNLLSDKTRFPYFMRMVPPDRYQARAIIQILAHFEWTYVSAVFSRGSYGVELVARLRELAGEHGVCLAGAHEVSSVTDRFSFRRLVRLLYASKAKVVVLLVDQEEARRTLRAVREVGLAGHFTWVGSDGLGMNLHDLDDARDEAVGSLSLQVKSAAVPGFQQYFGSLTPAATANPWFNDSWPHLFNCSWEARDDQTACQQYDSSPVSASDKYELVLETSRIMDAVLVLAHALHHLIVNRCPEASATDVRSCVTGDVYMRYLLNASLSGYIGNISFDNNGDVKGRYEILNFRRAQTGGGYVASRVGQWDVSTGQLELNSSAIVWGARATAKPVSHCGEKCRRGEIYSYFKNTCCWQCIACNRNEITAANASVCRVCMPPTWPDAANRSACVPLPVTSLGRWQPIVVFFIVVAIVGVLSCTATFVVYVRHNEARLIKATSRELSYVMLGGVTLQYVLVFGVVSPPTHFLCCFDFIGFNVSFAVIYAALLTRTNRIYRIFRAGRRTKVLPSFATPLSQVVIAVSLLFVQVLVNVTIALSMPPEAELRMPFAMEPHVELACTMPQRGFIVALCYNVLLVVVCTCYAFKARTLPNNFNETKYISFCVYTTLVIWLAFLPSYFTTTRAFFQVVLVCSALTLNASVTLLCLFAPKIYAVYTGARDVTFKFNSTSMYDAGQDTITTSINLTQSNNVGDEILRDCDDI